MSFTQQPCAQRQDVDKLIGFCLHHAVKWFALLGLIFLLVAMDSCTTLVNRRDLYSPEPGPESLEAARQWYGVTTTTTTTATSPEVVSPADVRRY